VAAGSVGVMRTVDQRRMRAPAERVFAAASEVERWPELLPHYRWVRMLERRPDGGIVAMSANRPFGPLDWPTWWTSEMWIDAARREVRYRHVRGITRGMDVVWRLVPDGEATDVSIVHEWDGPPWPLIRRPAAEWVIGPVFVHGIASRTLAGIARAVESASAEPAPAGSPQAQRSP
jgi:ribosome-associated toxin RatA of RatAB toxin-antitoxin module